MVSPGCILELFGKVLKKTTDTRSLTLTNESLVGGCLSMGIHTNSDIPQVILKSRQGWELLPKQMPTCVFTSCLRNREKVYTPFSRFLCWDLSPWDPKGHPVGIHAWGAVWMHSFPKQETYIKIPSPPLSSPVAALEQWPYLLSPHYWPKVICYCSVLLLFFFTWVRCWYDQYLQLFIFIF